VELRAEAANKVSSPVPLVTLGESKVKVVPPPGEMRYARLGGRVGLRLFLCGLG
jgi:hypothetical protein